MGRRRIDADGVEWCANGHAVDGRNVYEHPDGRARCVACGRDATARYRRRERQRRRGELLAADPDQAPLGDDDPLWLLSPGFLAAASQGSRLTAPVIREADALDAEPCRHECTSRDVPLRSGCCSSSSGVACNTPSPLAYEQIKCLEYRYSIASMANRARLAREIEFWWRRQFKGQDRWQRSRDVGSTPDGPRGGGRRLRRGIG